MRRRTLVIVIAVVILVAIIFSGTSFYLDLLWFKELQAESIFWTQLFARWGLRLAAWLLLFSFIFVNLLITRRQVLSFPNLALREQLMAGGYMRLLTPRRLTVLFLIISAVLSWMFSGFAAGYWMELLRLINAVPFNVSDPIFGADVSFYVFRLPFYRFIYAFLMLSLILPLILVGLIYLILNPPLQRGHSRFNLPPGPALSHIAALLAGIFALKAWDYRLQQLELVLSDRGIVFGAGYTDIFANQRLLVVLMVLAAVIAALFVANIFLRRPRLLLYGFLILVGVSLLGGAAFPAAMQSFVVEPREFALEKEYLQHNIDFTRRAYGLDNFKTRNYPAGEALAWGDLLENPGTINNVRLWDYRPLGDTLNELQAIRLYYRFHDVDIDRYTVDGQYRQVMLAARELDKERLAQQAQTWVNLHLQYTHGYGLTMSPVNEVSAEGLPRYFIRDIPPVTAEGLNLEQPSIYFGELTDDYVIVNTKTPEFHYATAGDENEFTHYDGEAGIPLNFFRRLLFALKFGEYRIAVSGELTGASRVLFDRDISTRVRKLAPFLRYDSDPYMVIDGGRLFWIQDAFTTTGSYPYATPYGGINYIRNSVKVVVDAYNGSVDYYIIDPDDPLAATYNRIFPDLFKPYEEMPAGLIQHFRYPEDLFNLQAQVTTLYHVTDPNVFYTREDLWAIPEETYENRAQQMEPYYTILELPGYDEPELVLILPFTPDKRNNMIAWMVARCDQPNYGRVELFLFPKERVVLGPRQIENRIDQSTEISAQFTLWSQAGSDVIRGNLLVLPINDALLYVEPIFLRAEGGGLPELARVIVVFQETVVMEETLEKALESIFGSREDLPPEEPAEEPPQPPLEPAGEDLAALIRRAQEVYDEALERQREGDWAGYGSKIAELKQILDELAQLSEAGD